MIKNERQYNITKKKLKEFEAEFEEMKLNESLHPLEKQLHLNSLQSFIEEFKELLFEYERLKAGNQSQVLIESLHDLPKALIKCRIMAGLSQSELAGKLGMPEQQVQRYEACNYSTASMDRLNQILSALGCETSRFSLCLPSRKIHVSEEVSTLAAFANEKLSRNRTLISL